MENVGKLVENSKPFKVVRVRGHRGQRCHKINILPQEFVSLNDLRIAVPVLRLKIGLLSRLQEELLQLPDHSPSLLLLGCYFSLHRFAYH